MIFSREKQSTVSLRLIDWCACDREKRKTKREKKKVSKAEVSETQRSEKICEEVDSLKGEKSGIFHKWYVNKWHLSVKCLEKSVSSEFYLHAEWLDERERKWNDSSYEERVLYANVSICTYCPGKYWRAAGNFSNFNFRTIGEYTDQIFDKNVTTIDSWTDNCVTFFWCTMIFWSTQHINCVGSKFRSHFTEIFIWTLRAISGWFFKQCIETLYEFIVITESWHLSP